jgi:AraC family transcriptional regulator
MDCALVHNLVVICTAGQANMFIETDGAECCVNLGPNQVWVVRGGCEIASYSWSGVHETLVVELRPMRLKHLMGDDDCLGDLQLIPQDVIPDRPMAALLCNMRAEIEAGCPSGPLYAESLSLALLTYLTSRYGATGPRREMLTPTLSPAEYQRVRDYVRSHLSQDLGLTELAEVVQLSPHHFCLLFRNTAGITPYQYVIHQRIHDSMKQLAAERISIAEIAGAFGFADQSHFTTVFRKVTGITPRQYRNNSRRFRTISKDSLGRSG